MPQLTQWKARTSYENFKIKIMMCSDKTENPANIIYTKIMSSKLMENRGKTKITHQKIPKILHQKIPKSHTRFSPGEARAKIPHQKSRTSLEQILH